MDVGVVDVAGRGQDSPPVLRRDPRQQPSIRDDRFEQRGRVAKAAAELGVRIQPGFRSVVHAHEDSSVPENRDTHPYTTCLMVNVRGLEATAGSGQSGRE